MLLSQINAAASRVIHLLDKCTSPSHIHQIKAQLILHNLHADTDIAYCFITACESLGLLNSAYLLYSQLPRPHVFICNNLMRAFSHSHFPHKSILIYSHMNRNSVLPNNYSFPFVIKALSDLGELRQGQSVHTQIVKLGHLNDIYVGNSLLSMYASCGDMQSTRKVFDKMPNRDVVSWTVMIMGYKEAGKFDDALIAFEQMQLAGVIPNRVTMVNALSACSSFGAVDMGIWIHDYVRRSGWELDVILGTSLIDMYGKCGRIEEALDVFKSMKEKNVFTWNAVIKTLALAKTGDEAVFWFSRMEQEGIKPDEVSLLGILSACDHSGLVDLGRRMFSLLINGKYGFSPGVKHYSCMIDMLARSGHLEDAYKMIKEMPFKPTKAIWSAFLAGCRAHGDLELSEFAAWKLIELDPDNGGSYILLSNIYAQMGRWSDVVKIRRLMRERRLRKDLGYSSVEVQPQDRVHELLA
ncbi:hypothetical protein NMG60_11015299 [Bertholletia excelsa]